MKDTKIMYHILSNTHWGYNIYDIGIIMAYISRCIYRYKFIIHSSFLQEV